MKRYKSLVVLVLSVVLTMSVFVSCGKPDGALVWIEVINENSLVTIDDNESVHFSDLKNPVLLPPNMHTITVEYLDSGDTETKTMNLAHGFEYRISFDKYDESVVSIDSQIPAHIWVGNIEVGAIPAKNRILVHAGQRKLKGELVGFGYRWEETRDFQTGDHIELQPGTDEAHGALYIESATTGASIFASIDDEPMRHNGSVFYPMVEPGVIEVTEQFSDGIIHYINVYPGKVTKLKFIDDHTSTDKTYSFGNLKAGFEMELLVCWGDGGVTKCNLENFTSKITDLDLKKLTPFRGTGLGLNAITKYFVARKDGEIGVASFSGVLPESINLTYSNEKGFDSRNIELMDAQVFAGTSPDGEYYYYEDGILKADGSNFVALKSFVPGCWDMETGDVLVTGSALDDGLVEFKIESVYGTNQLYYPLIELEELKENKSEFKVSQGFFLDDYFILGVLGLPDMTKIWKISFDEAVPVIDISKGMHNSELFGYRYLVCYPNMDSRSNGYVVDIESGNVSQNTEDIPNISITTDGDVLSGHTSGKVSAGVAYKFDGKKLIPYWAGVFGQ